MQQKVILRSFSTPYVTLGHLSVGGLFDCYTLELPWLDNVNDKSCIPAGTYQCRKHQSPAHGSCIAVDGVPGRTHILIHAGNYTYNTQGCILVGKGIADINTDGIPDVTSSRDTLEKLMSQLPNTFTLEVKRCL